MTNRGGDLTGADPVPEARRVLTTFPALLQAADGERRVLDHVALLTLNRPAVRNAIDHALVLELADALERLDADEACRCIVITGAGDRAFAAGADVGQLSKETKATLTDKGGFAAWDRVSLVRTPTIAAVRGWALGGGAELAMMCDMIVAGDDARFGQPEIRLGIIPGLGGTQRLVRAVGKAKAMELVLTGRTLDAVEAEACGLVTRVVPTDEVLASALELAETIAGMSPVAVRAAKRAVDDAFELPLSDGLRSERRRFSDLFGTADQQEGMTAFLERREPRWRGR
jgi:enoyl-CoA hydratase